MQPKVVLLFVLAAVAPVAANDNDNINLLKLYDRIPGSSKYLSDTERKVGNLRQGSRKLKGLWLTDMNVMTPEKLVEILTGKNSNINILDVSYTGATVAAGTFATTDTSIFGFVGGIVLTSGSVANIKGPNVSHNTTQDNGLPGDAQLDALVIGQLRNPTQDATILQFDFECPGTLDVSVEYVFMSEEYNEFVNSPFNDVFGFFLNGKNIALLSDGHATAINSVNCGTDPFRNAMGENADATNCDLYINNENGYIDTEMDGMTKVLTAYGDTVAGPNRIRLAIADVGDRNFDSAVLLKSGSFNCIIPSDIPSSSPTKTASAVPSGAPTPEPLPTFKPTFYDEIPNGSLRSEGDSNVDVVLINSVGGAAGGGGGGDSSGVTVGGGSTSQHAEGEGSGATFGFGAVGGSGKSAGNAFAQHGGKFGDTDKGDGFLGAGGWGGESEGFSFLDFGGGGGGFGTGRTATSGNSNGFATASGRGFG